MKLYNGGSLFLSISYLSIVVILLLFLEDDVTATVSFSTTSSSAAEDYYYNFNAHHLRKCLTNHSSSTKDPNISSLIYTSDDKNTSPSYSSVLQSYIRNLRFNTSTTPKPILILTAFHESHVQAAVICSKQERIELKIRSGGHDYEGLSYVSIYAPFFVLDMSNLRSVNVSMEDETAWVESGATLGEIYYSIAQKSRVHAFPAGVCPTVGAGGHFSGGGYGNLMRKYGLSIDHIIDALVVDAKGRLLDREAMGDDLFWAIRGGGGASFGVILAYKIKLVRVPENVTVFRVERTCCSNNNMEDQEQDDGLLDTVVQWQQVAAGELDDDLFIRLTMDVVAVDVVTNGNKTAGAARKTHHGHDDESKKKTKTAVRCTFRGMFLGDAERLLAIVGDKIPGLGLNRSDCHEMSWVDSVVFWTDFPLGTPPSVLLNRTPSSLTYLKRKSDYVKHPIPAQGFQGIWKKMVELVNDPAQLTFQLTFNPYGGKMAQIPANQTAFPHRAGNMFLIQYAANWNQPGSEAAGRYIDVARELYAYMTPYVSKHPREAFLNYRDIDLGVIINRNQDRTTSYFQGRRYGIKYFKDNFHRLVKIKEEVDPHNLFSYEQSVPLPRE